MSWLIRCICAVSEVGTTDSMRLKRYSKIAAKAGQCAPATAQVSGNAVIDPINVAASRACMSPCSSIFWTKLGSMIMGVAHTNRAAKLLARQEER